MSLLSIIAFIIFGSFAIVISLLLLFAVVSFIMQISGTKETRKEIKKSSFEHTAFDRAWKNEQTRVNKAIEDDIYKKDKNDVHKK